MRHVTSYLDAANLIASFNAFFTRLYFLSANYRKWDVNVCGRALGQACLKMLALFPRSADGDGDVRNCLASELLKVAQNIDSFCKT